MNTQRTYTMEEIQNLLANLDNEITCGPQEKMGKYKRVQLPIPKEYGGGIATGYGYEEAVHKLIERIRDKIFVKPAGPAFCECWKEWIAIKEGQDKSVSTIDNYKWIAKHYLLPYFGEKPIDSITADDIQKYYNSIMRLSKTVSVQSKAILCGIFDRAARLGDVERNVMLYRYEKSNKTGTKVVLQDDQLIDVIKQLDILKQKDVRDYLYGCFLCFTALRRGEILGLCWEDIDFETCEIHVRNNVTYPNGVNDYHLSEPKDGSVGVVHLQSELERRILPYRKERGYILFYNENETDKPMTRSMFNKMWSRIGKKIDLKGATSHSFRASYATMMNAHCDHIDPKALQGALRHKTPDLAIKVYTKENRNKTREAEIEYDNWLSERIGS